MHRRLVGVQLDEVPALAVIPDDDRGDGRTVNDCSVSADGETLLVRGERLGVALVEGHLLGLLEQADLFGQMDRNRAFDQLIADMMDAVDYLSRK